MDRFNTLTRAAFRLSLLALLLLPFASRAQTTLAKWDFNDGDIAADAGSGTLSAIGGVTAGFASATITGNTCCSASSTGTPGQAYILTNYPVSLTGNGTAGVQINRTTVGYTDIEITWDQRCQQGANRFVQLKYSIDGTNFITTGLANNGIIDLYPPTGSGGSMPGFANNNSIDLSSLNGPGLVSNNPNFKIQLVSVFDPAGSDYSPANNGFPYTPSHGIRYDNITITGVVDSDSDGIADVVDNCPNDANFNQSNIDGDPAGDVCDYCPTLPGYSTTGPVRNLNTLVYYCTIQAAVNAASAGHVIQVDNGTYAENVSVTKALTIQGQSASGVIIVPAGADSHDDSRFGGTANNAFTIRSSNVTIKTLTVDGDAGFGGSGSRNFRNAVVADNTLGNYSNTVVDGVIARHIARRGVDLRVLNAHTAGNQIKNCSFTDIGAPALASSAAAVAIFGCDGLIDNNTITSSCNGIFCNGVYDGGTHLPLLTISRNQITNLSASAQGSGMNLAAMANGSVIGGNSPSDGNIINTTAGANDEIGALVTFSNGSVTVKNNTFTSTAGDGALWLFRNEAQPVIVANNAFTASGSTAAADGEGTAVLITDDPTAFGENDCGIGRATLTGNTISGYVHPVDILRKGTVNSGPKSLYVTIGGTNPADDNSITGSGSSTGIRILDTDGTAGQNANVTVQGNNASIHGFAIGIDVDGASTTISTNHIYDNGIGVRVTNGGTVSSLTSNNFNDATDNGRDVQLTASAGTVTIATNNSFAGDTYYIENLTGQNYDLTGGSTSYEQTDNYAREDRMYHKLDNVSSGLIIVIANNLYVTAPGTGSSDETIQRAVDASSNGFTVNVQNGTYDENVSVTKDITIDGQSRSGTILKGTYAGTRTLEFPNSGANGATVQDMTVTRDYQDWYGSTNNYGVLVSGGATSVTLDNLYVVDNRNGVYAENSSTIELKNSLIEKNRTGIHLSNTVLGSIHHNIIRDNQTHGLFFNANDGISNLSGMAINDNKFYGNWYSQVCFRGANAVTTDLECNWLGTDAPTVNATDPGELGYSGSPGTYLVPQQLGGSAASNSVVFNGALRGNQVVGADYIDWRTGQSGNMSDPFAPSDMCNGTPVVAVLDATTLASCATTADGSITIQVTDGTYPSSMTYAWSGGPSVIGNVQNPTGILPGTYNVTVTDGNGSTATITGIVVGITTWSGPTWFVSTTGSDSNTGSSGCPFQTIQFAVNTASNGHTVQVADGTYTENVSVTKDITIDGQSRSGTILKGTYAGTRTLEFPNSGANGATVQDMTVTRDYQDWYGSTNNYGVLVSGGATSVTLDNLYVVDNRNGVYAENSSTIELKNSLIEKNRTGIHLSNTVLGSIHHNIIRDNQTHGLFFNANDGISNLSGMAINDNKFYGNWYSQVCFRGANAVTTDLECNWLGTDAPTVNATDPGELGYSGSPGTYLVPQQLGGSAASNSVVFNGALRGNQVVGADYIDWRTGQSGNMSDPFAPSDMCNGTPVVAVLDATTLASCATTADGSITIQVTDGTYPSSMTYAWSGGPSVIGNVQNPTGILPGTYNVTVTDGNGSTATITGIVVGITTWSGPTWFVSTTGSDSNTGSSGCPFQTIQFAVNTASSGDTVQVAAGTYNEDVTVNKQLSVLGAGIGSSTVSGPIGGGGSTFQVVAANVLVDGFSITRAGNNTTDWNNSGLNSAGIAIQGQTVFAEVRNCEITGMRTGIDINNSNGNNVHNNYIHFNHTGMIFRNQTDNTSVLNNIIRENRTVGVLFLDASGGTNSPVQTAANCSFNDNDISGNWYGQIVDRQIGGSLPAPGTTNLKDLECNWYGSTAPVYSTANSAEPPYAGHIPVEYGGSATPPGGQPDILGPASANFVYSPYHIDGTDDGGTPHDGFQPSSDCDGTPVVAVLDATTLASCATTADGSITIDVSGGTYPTSMTYAWSGGPSGIGNVQNPTGILPGTYNVTVTDGNGSTATITGIVVGITPYSGSTWYVSTTGSNTNTGSSGCPFQTIQFAVNNAGTLTGHVVQVAPGTYTENVTVNKSVTVRGGTGAPATRPVVTATTGTRVFAVTTTGVTIENLTVQFNQAPVLYGIDAPNAGTYGGLMVKDSRIEATATTGLSIFGSMGIRLGTTGSSAGDQVTLTNNTITHTGTSPMGRGVRSLYAYGTWEGNSIDGTYSMQTGNIAGGELHIVNNPQLKGMVEVNNLIYNGSHSVAGNIFGLSTSEGANQFAGIELKDLRNASASLLIDGNDFNNLSRFGIFSGRANYVTISNNEFNPAGGTYTSVRLDTKQRSNNVAPESTFMCGAVLTNNLFDGTGGIALELARSDSNSDFAGVTLTTNMFYGTNGQYIRLNNNTGSTASDPVFAGLMPVSYTTEAKVTLNVDATNNTYSGTAANTMSPAQHFAAEDKVQHKTDDVGLGVVRMKAGEIFVTTNSGSIQRGVDAATAGDIVNVAEGSFAENVNVNKGVTLLGANAGIACGSRGLESIIIPASGAPVTIAANSVTLNGFELTAPTSANAIVAASNNNLSVVYNKIHDIAISGTGLIAHAVQYTAATSANNVLIADNCISNINNPGNNQSGSGVAIGFSGNSGTLGGLQILRNSISGVHSKDLLAGGKGAYGIIVNLGAANGVGNASGAVIADNVISDIDGLWAHAIGLEGNTPGAQVLNNSIDDLASTKVPSDAEAIRIEQNTGVASVTINENSFTNTAIGIHNNTATALPNATCNWYGSPSANAVEAMILSTPGAVTYAPYLVDGSDLNAAIGFQPDPLECTGSPIVATEGTTTDVSCNGGSDGSIDVDISGGTSPNGLSFAWTGPDGFTSNNEDISGLVVGTYELTVTDGNGSTDVLQVVVGEPVLPSASISDNNGPICYNTTATFNLTGSDGATVHYTLNAVPASVLLTGGSASVNVNNAVVAQTLVLDSIGVETCYYPLIGSSSISIIPSASVASVSGASPLCIGATATYTANSVVLGGGTGAWSSSNESVATVNPTSGLVTAVAPGTSNIIFTITGGCNGTPTAQQSLTVLPDAAVASVSGTSPLCIGATATYTATGVVLGGGTGAWSSSNESVATVNPTSGLVTAVAPGTSNIIFTITGGCNGTPTAQQSLTVLPDAAVASVSGTSPLCIGATATYTATGVVLGGGTGAWSSSNESVATVNPTSGLVTAVAPGTSNIIFTITGGCNGTPTAQQSLTVLPDAAVASVSGTSPLCIGATATYTATGVVLGGGTGAWSSSDTDVATVHPTSGLVTAVAPGTSNIIFTITGGCNGAPTAQQSLTVLPDAAVGSVTGISALCINGGTTAFTANGVVLGGGTGAWSSSNPLVATVDVNGIVTPVAAGSTNIIYTVTGGCNGTASAQQSLTIDPLPTASAGGSQSICVATPAVVSGASASFGTILWTVQTGNGTLTNANTLTPTYNAVLADAGTTVTLKMTVTSNNSCAPQTAIAFYTVNVYLQPSLAASSHSNLACYGDNNATVSLVANGGTLPYNYFIGNPPVNGLGAGNYVYSLSDDNGCVASYTANIVDPPLLAANVNGPTTVCYGEDGIVTFTGTPSITVYYTVTGVPGTQNVTLSGGGTANVNLGALTSAVTVTLVSATSPTPCSNSLPPAPWTVNVNPAVSMNDPADQTVCNGASTSVVTFTGSATSYNWTNDDISIGLGASGTGDIASFVATNTTNAPVIATITVTPVANGCPGPAQTFTITVNPTPTVDDPANQTVCNGGSTTGVTFTSAFGVAGTTYNWTNNDPSIGLAASGSGDIASFVATNATNAPVTATITVTPSANGCPGTAQTFTITVNPTPTVDDPANQTVCNGGSTTAVTFTSAFGVAGTTYNWSNDDISIGLGASGTGDIASFTATNTTNAPVVATITVTPSANGCPGTPQTFTITVNPTPTVDDPADQTVCNGGNTTAVSFTSAFNVAGTTYNWTNNDPSIGLAASGSGDIASFVATNATNAPVTATITVTPSANGCPGTPQTFTITVNPTPTVDDPADQTVCNGGNTTAVSFTSAFNVAGTTYNWTNNDPSIGLAASGSGDIASFVATNATNAPVTATITVTPSANGCPGTAQTFTITVNPTPTVDDPADQTVCNGGNTTAVSFTSAFNVAGTTYNWTNNDPSIGLAASGSGDIASFVATNATNAPVTATITVTPSANGCPGTAQTFTITVNPTPTVDDPADQTVCNGGNTTAVSFTSAFNVAGTTYNWTNNDPSIGLAASGSGDIASFVATNATNAPVTATITVTPSANGCPGTAQTFTITVNPTPTVDDPADQTVCNGGNTTAVSFTSAFNVAGTTYNWSNNDPSIGLAASGSGDIASFVATNATNAPVTATITVIPSANGCPGTPQTFTITVNPTPTVDDPADQTVCNGGNTTAVSFTSAFNVAGTTYNWTNNDPSIGLAASGSGDIASFVATNATNAPVTATITVTPSANGCPGTPQTFTITVNPTPTVDDPADQTVCNGGNTTAVSFTSAFNVAGTTYNWTNNDPSIGLAASGSGDIASFVATNATNAPVTATITVIPSANGCPGTPQTFTITVNPTPTVDDPADQTVCNGGNTTAVSFTSAFNVAGTTYNWTNNDISIGLGASGTGDIASFTATNTTNAPVVATITVTPSANGCPGTPQTFTITVNPTPTVDDPANQTVCNGGSTTGVTFTSAFGVAGTTYNWSNDDISIGLGASGTGDIASFTATNTTNAPVVATITVTPVANGCPGTPQTFTITVNPTPTVDDPADQTVCNGGNTTAVSFTSAFNVAGTTYNWTNNDISIGLGASGTGDIASFTATNTTNAPVVATITVTPVANGCPGTPQTFTITVNPTPTVDDPANQTVCNGGSTTGVTFTSAFGVASTTYNWSNDDISIGLGASGTGDIASFTATNTTNAPVVATITVTPVANGCPGTPQTFTITVNPTPTVDDPADQTVCNGGNTTAVSFTSAFNVAGTTYNWTNNDPSIGLAASGSGDIASFVATNATNAPVTATITVIPSANGCPGTPQTFTITVTPTPSTANAGPDQIHCSDGTFTLAGNIPAAGTGSWSIVSGTGTIVTPSAYNSQVTGVVGNFVVSWTITSGSCSSSDNVSLLNTVVGASCDDGNPNTTNDVYDNMCTCAGTMFVAVSARAILEGATLTSGPGNPPSTTMRDDLRAANYIPSAQPYNIAAFNFYNGGETVAPAVLANTDPNNAIVDWVLLDVRSTTGPAYTVLKSRAALLQRDGDIVDVDGVSPVIFLNMPVNNYRVSVRHRNHLGVMTALSPTLSGTPTSIDFSDPATLTYGTGAQKVQPTVGGRTVLWCGNARVDNVLRYTNVNNDRDAILVAIGGSNVNAVVFGYRVEDVNMTGTTTYVAALNDRDPILVNVGGIVNGQRFQQLP